MHLQRKLFGKERNRCASMDEGSRVYMCEFVICIVVPVRSSTLIENGINSMRDTSVYRHTLIIYSTNASRITAGLLPNSRSSGFGLVPY